MDPEDKTRIIRRPGQAAPGERYDEDEPTRLVGREDEEFAEKFAEEFGSDLDETHVISQDENIHAKPSTPAAYVEDDPAVVLPQRPPETSGFVEKDEATVVYRPSDRAAQSKPGDGPAPDSLGDHSNDSDDPVVGWLVIVEGPGRGHSFPLGYGINHVGRGDNQRVSIQFGDNEISRENHVLVTYDHKGRRFFAHGAEGSQLAYLGTAPLLQPVELVHGAVITIGQTRLAFVPFCGPSFDWKVE